MLQLGVLARTALLATTGSACAANIKFPEEAEGQVGRI